jgi:glycosyltransferase involved in cell wall biosynthesis
MLKISFIIIVHRDIDLFIDAYNSIVNSMKFAKNEECEIIVVSNGIDLKDFSPNYNTKSFCLNTNLGISYARNFGIEKSNYEWVYFVDGDDLVPLNLLLILKNYFDFIMESGCDFIYGDLQTFGSSKKKIYYGPFMGIQTIQFGLPPGAGVLIKRQWFLDIGEYDLCKIMELGNEDMEFWIRGISLGGNGLYLNFTFYFWRRYATKYSRSDLISNNIDSRRKVLEYIQSKHNLVLNKLNIDLVKENMVRKSNLILKILKYLNI